MEDYTVEARRKLMGSRCSFCGTQRTNKIKMVQSPLPPFHTICQFCVKEGKLILKRGENKADELNKIS
jgi:hypothetical protein